MGTHLYLCDFHQMEGKLIYLLCFVLNIQTAAELTKEEELEMKRLKARVQILYENRWRRGSIVNFDKTTGMELVFRDGGGTALTVTRESPLMIRVDDLVGLEEEISKNDISWVPLLASGTNNTLNIERVGLAACHH